jgi:hypothetical protein
MATKAAKDREKIYEFEVKRRRVKPGGGYEPFWKVKNVTEAITDEDTEFRCKDCGGEVKLFKSHKPGGPPSHAEHKNRSDSEYCVSGIYFRQATDGREPRTSANPVD